VALPVLNLGKVTAESGRNVVGVQHVTLRRQDIALRLLAARLCDRERVRGSGALSGRAVPRQAEG
jgi:hypothetical protein